MFESGMMMMNNCYLGSVCTKGVCEDIVDISRNSYKGVLGKKRWTYLGKSCSFEKKVTKQRHIKIKILL